MIKLKNERKHGELYDVFYNGYYIGDIAKNVQKEYFYFLPRAVQAIEITSECLKELAEVLDYLNG
ncbi:MAG: hypothetical protein GTO02_15885, partial [Candidatus Dadabacteria bacterium]|nr:hypothetical protein [Candidatus Dadabacteria bacterium]